MNRREAFATLGAAGTVALIGDTDFAESAPIKRTGCRKIAAFDSPITCMHVYNNKLVVATNDGAIYVIDEL